MEIKLKKLKVAEKGLDKPMYKVETDKGTFNLLSNRGNLFLAKGGQTYRVAWKDKQETILWELMNHSDCTGDIAVLNNMTVEVLT